jgi:hypothetical protein
MAILSTWTIRKVNEMRFRATRFGGILNFFLSASSIRHGKAFILWL